jgi:hypothetical protein
MPLCLVPSNPYISVPIHNQQRLQGSNVLARAGEEDADDLAFSPPGTPGGRFLRGALALLVAGATAGAEPELPPCWFLAGGREPKLVASRRVVPGAVIRHREHLQRAAAELCLQKGQSVRGGERRQHPRYRGLADRHFAPDLGLQARVPERCQ